MNIGKIIYSGARTLREAINGNREKLYFNTFAIEETDGEEIRIVPAGEFSEHHNGSHTITEKQLKEMEANLKEQGTDILFDYGHNSLWDGAAPAAGWSPSEKAEAREDGLYITRPEFTTAAMEKINNREYRYFSPVYVLNSKNKQGKETGARLISIGLTNTPYFDKEIDHINNTQTKRGAIMNKKILTFFGLPAEAGDREIENKIGKLREQSGAKEDENLEAIINRAMNTAQKRNEIEELKQKLDELTANREKEKAEEIVNSAIEAGRILPADKDVWLGFAERSPAECTRILEGKKVNSVMPEKVEVKTGKERPGGIEDAADYFRAEGRGK